MEQTSDTKPRRKLKKRAAARTAPARPPAAPPAVVTWAFWARRAAAIVVAAVWLWLLDRASARWMADHEIPLSVPASLTLLGGHGLGALALGIVGGACALITWGSRRVLGSSDGEPRAVVGALAYAAVFAYPADVVARAMVAGDWIRTQPWAGALRFGITASAVIAALAFGLVSFSKRARGAGRVAKAFVGASILASLVCALADAVVFPGLYPEAHVLLYATSAVFALTAATRLAEWVRAPSLGWQRTAVGLSGAALVSGGAAWWTMSPLTRSSIAMASPTVGVVMPYVTKQHKLSYLASVLLSLDVYGGTLEPRPDADARRAVVGARDDWNVILVIVDTLRVDGLPGFREGSDLLADGDMPFFRSWLGDSFRFRSAYSQASQTKVSIPPTFFSCQAYEGASRPGPPLASRFSALGLRPVAVLPQYFLMPIKNGARDLTDGFTEVAYYEKDVQSEFREQVREIVTPAAKGRFFAWLHYYGMHDPYYAGRLTEGADGSPRARYRMALSYFDEQMRDAMVVLGELGIADRTIIILTSDHGESLGENRLTGHGKSVYEEEVHIPMVVHVPGLGGGDIDTTVGNIDVLPTMLDLAGAEPDPLLRGRSLVPLLADPKARWERSYLLSNGPQTVVGVIDGHQKLIFDRKAKTFQRYDVGKDPEETKSLFGARSDDDRRLMERLYAHYPSMAKEELGDPSNLALVQQRLEDVPPDAPGEGLRLLLELMAAHPDPSLVDAAVSLFRETSSATAKWLIARHLAVADKERARELLASHVAGLSDAEATAFVAGLGRQKQPPFAMKAALERMRGYAKKPPTDAWLIWLNLTRTWPKQYATWHALFTDMLGVELDPKTTEALLDNVGTLVKVPAELAPELLTRLLALAGHPEPTVAAAAIEALGHLKAKGAVEWLATASKNGELPVRTRQAVLHAVTAIERADGWEVITELGKDRLLTVDAVEALVEVGDARALPYLQDLKDNHYNAYTRGRAEAAISAIRKRAKR